MQTYRLYVELKGGYYTNVEADSFDEAIDIAIADADPYNIIDWDIDAME